MFGRVTIDLAARGQQQPRSATIRQVERRRGAVRTGPQRLHSEALVTAYHRDRGTDVAIARIFNTYGPGMRADDGRMVPAFIEQAGRGTAHHRRRR